MDPAIIGVIGIVLVILLTFLGLPVAVIYFMSGFFGMLLLKGWEPSLDVLKRVTYCKSLLIATT